jgi:dCMP deaminase
VIFNPGSPINKKDQVYFEMAKSISKLSKDQNTKVGSIIIDTDGKVVSMGYNGCVSRFGATTGQNDEIVPHSREKQNITLNGDYSHLGIDDNSFSYNKYPFMIHSETNSILTTSDMNKLKGATIYCTHYPCASCASMISQVGIKTVKVLDNRHGTFKETIPCTLFVFENMGIKLEVFDD